MNIGVFGTGAVGNAICTKLVSLGHTVMMGSRSANGENVTKWVTSTGGKGLAGTFADAAKHGELLFNCTNGLATLEVIASCNEEDLENKTLIDISNPLDFSNGFPPSLSICNNDSLAERIQAAHPKLNVVKSLNTISNPIMVNPSLISGNHHIFVSGNNADAKQQTINMLKEFGWPETNIIDLGDITTSRGPEMVLPLWVRLYGALGTPIFNFDIKSSPLSV